MIVVGLARGAPLAPLPAASTVTSPRTVGILLLLAALASGRSALTGIEAIANATPSFREPRRAKARTAEAGLGIVLGALLMGLAAVIQRFGAHPVDGRTLLSVLAEGSIGTGWGYVVVQLSTTLLLALAANTSFDGLPVLAAKVAADGALPHVFGLRGDRQVYRTSIFVLTVLSAALLLASAGQVNVLVPLFAIGVFVGFTLCQVGMLRHWWRDRGPGWRPRAALNGFGAVLTAVAAVVLTVEKFTEGAWLVALVIPLMVAGFQTVRPPTTGSAGCSRSTPAHSDPGSRHRSWSCRSSGSPGWPRRASRRRSPPATASSRCTSCSGTRPTTAQRPPTCGGVGRTGSPTSSS